MILTKDEDFAARRTLNAQGPAIVWIRVGNTSRSETVRWFEAAFPDILVALDRGDALVEMTSDVGQLPTWIHTTFGGGPYNRLR